MNGLKLQKRVLIGLTVILIPVLAFAADGISVPEGDALQTLLQLILNWKASSPVIIGAGLITVIVQGVKAMFGDFVYKKTLVVVLGVIYSILMSIASGLSVGQAAALVLFTSGGAVAIYEAVKDLFKKPVA